MEGIPILEAVGIRPAAGVDDPNFGAGIFREPTVPSILAGIPADEDLVTGFDSFEIGGVGEGVDELLRLTGVTMPEGFLRPALRGTGRDGVAVVVEVGVGEGDSLLLSGAEREVPLEEGRRKAGIDFLTGIVRVLDAMLGVGLGVGTTLPDLTKASFAPVEVITGSFLAEVLLGGELGAFDREDAVDTLECPKGDSDA